MDARRKDLDAGVLTASTLLRALVEARLVDPVAAVAPGTVLEAGGGRRGAWILRTAAGGVAVKLAASAAGRAALGRERRAYQQLHRHGEPSWAPRALAPFLEGLAVTVAPGGQPLLARLRRAAGRDAAMSLVGRALAALHGAPRSLFPPQGFSEPAELAWLFEGRQPRRAPPPSAGTLEVRDYLRVCGVGLHLSRLREQLTRTTPCHGDARADNWVLVGRARAQLVDWETAHLGDPAWDVGAVLASLLWGCLRSAPIVPGRDVVEALARARFPLAAGQSAARAFAQAYFAARSLEVAGRPSLWLRSLECAGARLVQHVLEWMEDLARPSEVMRAALHLALFTLAEPAVAAEAVWLGAGGLSKTSIKAIHAAT